MSKIKLSLMLQAGIAGLLLVACAPATVEDSATTSSEVVSVSSSKAATDSSPEMRPSRSKNSANTTARMASRLM